jgi:7-carboxy-7-deazaguanine synthase
MPPLQEPSTPSATVRLKVSEIFDSVQGEGVSVGTPCTFLRLAGCNLTCTWCDTPYSWDWQRYDYESEVTRYDVLTLAQRLAHAPRLVVTGGEPLLQRAALALLLEQLPAQLVIEVETNGTKSAGPALLERVGQWNVSAKLGNSGEAVSRRLVEEPLRQFRDTGRAWLKLVIESDADAAEAQALVERLAWPTERVLFMPQASTREALLTLLPRVQRLAMERDFGWSSRIHIERWGGRRGV